jgi:hypothetical protein
MMWHQGLWQGTNFGAAAHSGEQGLPQRATAGSRVCHNSPKQGAEFNIVAYSREHVCYHGPQQEQGLLQ